MTKTYMLLAVAGLSLAACGGQSQTANQTADAARAEPEQVASAAAPGVLRGGAVDVLQREGWRVTVQQADASSATSEPTAG